jgi:hypothetical protein
MAAVFALVMIPIVVLVGSFARIAINDGGAANTFAAVGVSVLALGVFFGVLRMVLRAEKAAS